MNEAYTAPRESISARISVECGGTTCRRCLDIVGHEYVHEIQASTDCTSRLHRNYGADTIFEDGIVLIRAHFRLFVEYVLCGTTEAEEMCGTLVMLRQCC